METAQAKIGIRVLAGLHALILTLALLLSLSGPQPLTAAASPTPGAATGAPGPTPAPASVMYPDALVIEHSSAGAIAIETSRGRILYAKDARARLDLPAASKVMTALLAVEKGALDARVTISNTVADAAYFETTGDGIRLRTGDKYSLEYLLLRMLFYDSDAAAHAIAESIANDEREFVRQMNARAAALGLKTTLFATASGRPPMTGQPGQPAMTPTPAPTRPAGPGASPAPAAGDSPYTTVSDLASLMQRALQNDRFSRLFRKQSEFLIIDGRNLVPMSNQIARLWPYSEGRVNGAYQSAAASGPDKAVTIATGTVNGFGVISVTANGQVERVVDDTLALLDACQRTYVVSPLVQAGDPFTGAQETTRDGETFGLVYQQTIQYVHPIGDLYIKTPTTYKSFGPYSRPIQSSMTVGQVVFELMDGTLIPVNVGPDRQILSNISLLDRLLNQLQANRNLYYLLVSSLVLVLVIAFGQLAVYLIRLYDRHRS